jgi:hypothetical protein
MSIADVFLAIISLILLGMAFPSLLFLLTLSFPKLVEQTKEEIEKNALRNFFRGILIFGLTAILLVSFFNMPGPSKLLALLIFLITLSTTMIGGAGLINHLANKYEIFSKSQKSVTNIFYSTFFLELAVLLPFVGWFIVLPATFCLMLGAGSKTILRRPKFQKKSLNIHPPQREPFISTPSGLHPTS